MNDKKTQRIVVFCNYLGSIIRFRGAILDSFAKSGHTVTVFSPPGPPEIIARLRVMGVSHRTIPMSRAGFGVIEEVFTFLKIFNLLKDLKPDIVLNYTIKPVIYGSLAAKLVGVPNVYSVIPGLGYIFLGKSYKHWLLRYLVTWLYRLSLSLNRVIFFLNKDDLGLFLHLGIIKHSQKAVVLNGEGVDLAHYSVRSRPQKTDSFLFIGRLIADKGVIEYIKAALIVKSKYPDITFRILGPIDTNPTAIPIETIREYVQSGVIEYLGEQKDVRTYIDQCGVFVLPSYREGLPASGLEAMAMGRPIITTDVPGCREIVIDGFNGHLVPVRDIKSLSEAMEKFILNPQLGRMMGDNSRKYAEDRFDVHKVTSTFIESIGLKHETTI